MHIDRTFLTARMKRHVKFLRLKNHTSRFILIHWIKKENLSKLNFLFKNFFFLSFFLLYSLLYKEIGKPESSSRENLKISWPRIYFLFFLAGFFFHLSFCSFWMENRFVGIVENFYPSIHSDSGRDYYCSEKL